MAANPAWHPPSADRRPVLGCRLYVDAASDAPGDADVILAALRDLQQHLDAFACGPGAGRPRPPLGAFVRRFVAWLNAHPGRGNEPLAWLIRDVLLEQSADAPGQPRSP